MKNPQSLGEVLQYTGERFQDDEKALRSVAFLLEWSSEKGGNAPISPGVARGLAQLLHDVGDDLLDHQAFMAKQAEQPIAA